MKTIKHLLKSPSFYFLFLVLFSAIFAQWLAPFPVDEIQTGPFFGRPSLQNLFGTDVLGRDLFSRILFGAQVSLSVGLSTALFSCVVGLLIGLPAGYFGGRVDRILMAFADMMLTFPTLLLAILFTLMVGRGPVGIFLSIALTAWPTQARLIRGLAMQLRKVEYLEAAHAIGASIPRQMGRHIIPNLLGPLIVSLSFQIPNNIMAESFLSFIGLGIEPPFTSWGSLANEGFLSMQNHPHLIIFPGLALFLTLLALNFLGDRLKESLDPKSKIDYS